MQHSAVSLILARGRRSRTALRGHGPRCLGVFLLALSAACGTEDPSPPPTAETLGTRVGARSLPACLAAEAYPLRVDTLAEGLEVPWDVAFLTDGRALLTERAGRIRVVEADGSLRAEPWATLPVYAQDEAGLMGIDVIERADGTRSVFVAATFRDLGSPALGGRLSALRRRVERALNPERGHTMTWALLRIDEVGGRPGEPTPVLSGIPAASLHAGGAVRIGPDGLLYLAVGDAAAPPTAQLMASHRGKILRVTPDGTVPVDNPVPGSPFFAWGVRNPQGLAWHPESGTLLALDHGPTGMEAEGFRTDDDELNEVGPGTNLGWPLVTGPTEGGALQGPLASWTPAIAPAGLTVLDALGSPWHGNVFVTALRGNALHRIELESIPSGWQAACEERLLHGVYGRLRLVRAAPDGTLWIGTSNRDGRGLPRGADDLLLRLHPPVGTIR